MGMKNTEHDDTDDDLDEDLYDDDLDDEDGEGDDDEPATNEDGSPITRAQIKALEKRAEEARARVKRQKGGGRDSSANEKRVKELEDKLAKFERAGKPPREPRGLSEEDVADRIAEAVAKRDTEITDKANTRVINVAAKAALEKANFLPKGKRALALLDLSDVEVDEDGEVIGLDDALEDLKEESPELFAEPAKRRRGDGGRDREPGRRDDKEGLTATERQARAIARGSKR